MSGSRTAARFAASAAFLAAFTVAILLVRSALSDDTPQPAATATTPAQTQTRAQPATTAATTAPATTTRPATTAPEPEYYEIQSGDTLEVVASREGTTVERLLILNPDVDPVALTIGQRIRVR